MTGGLLALALLAAIAETATAGPEQVPELEIAPCVEVDAAAVRTLMELQMRDLRTTHPSERISVAVSCAASALEVRVEPWASRGANGVLSIDLPAAGGTDAAAREARARELALAIAEVVRRLELTHPLAEPPAPVPAPPPASAPQQPPPSNEASIRPSGRWQLGLVGAVDHFEGGQTLWGADLVLGARVGRFLVGELRAGGRAGESADLPWVRVTTRAASASAAIGVNLWSARPRVTVALMGVAQGYLVEFQSAPAGPSNAGAGWALAVVLAAEPRLKFTVTRRLSLTIGAAAGGAVHGIVFETQGAVSQSLTGLLLSANLGAVFTF